MIKVVGNSIRIPRGDTGTLQFQVFTAQRTPYILPEGLTAPVIVCAVAKKTDSLELGENLLIKKLFALPSDMPQFDSEILDYANDTHDTSHVFKKADGTYCFFTGTVGDLTEYPYNFVLSIPFEPSNTNSMAAGSYRFTCYVVDGESYETWYNDIDTAIAGITFKDTLVEARDFMVEPAGHSPANTTGTDAPGWQYLDMDPIGAYLEANNYPYIVVSGALPLTVFYKPTSIVSVEKTSTAGLVDTYTITYSDGTTSIFTVTNGQDGNIVDVVEDTASQAVAATVESNKMYPFTNVPASSVNVTIPASFVAGSFAEVSFVAGNNVANNGITVVNNSDTPVVLVEYGISMSVSEWRPEYGKQVSLLLCNNGINIVIGVIEA